MKAKKGASDETSFYMCEPIACQRTGVFGTRYSVWQRILQSTYGRGRVHVTQKQIAIEFGLTERAVQRHYAAFKDAGMLEVGRNRDGRVAFRVSPEFYWNFRVEERNKEIRERGSDQERTA